MRLEDIGDEPPIATAGIKRPGALGDDPRPIVDLSDAEADRRGGMYEAVAVEGLLGAYTVARPLRADGEESIRTEADAGRLTAARPATDGPAAPPDRRARRSGSSTRRRRGAGQPWP